MTHVNLFIAFVGGLVSFLAPCFLPIIPGFLAYLAGTSLEHAGAKRREMFLNSLAFVAGFSVVFAALGVLLNTILEQVAQEVQTWLARLGGLIIIFFGLYLIGLVRLPFLEREHRLLAPRRFSTSYVTSFLFGFAFAAGWTPCVGVALGPILGLAATAPGTALYLLLAYALGLGLPFLVVGLFAGSAQAFIARHERTLRHVSRVFGALIVALGVLIFTQQLNLIANFSLLNQWLLP